MDLKKTLHSISHLKWIFLIAQVILILYCFIALPENLISIIGIIIFLTGIQLGFESLSDIEKISAKERERFQSTRLAKKISVLLLTSIVILIIISSLFLSLKFLFPGKQIFNEFFDLGLDCWALILGLLCQLKSVYDKENYVTGLQPVSLQDPDESQAAE